MNSQDNLRVRYENVRWLTLVDGNVVKQGECPRFEIINLSANDVQFRLVSAGFAWNGNQWVPLGRDATMQWILQDTTRLRVEDLEDFLCRQDLDEFVEMHEHSDPDEVA